MTVSSSARPEHAPQPDINPPPFKLENSVRLQVVTVAALLLFFLVNGLIAARTHTPTVDEFAALPTGLYHLKTGQFDIDRTNPPLVRMLAALPLLVMDARLDLDPRWRGHGEGWWPWVFGTKFMHDNEATYFNLFFAGRMVIVGFGVALGLGIFLWARSLFGATVAAATLLLYCTCPIVLGHTSLATLDVGVTMLLVGGFLTLLQLARTRSLWWAALSGALFGLAITAKFNALFFLPLIPLLLAMEWLPEGRQAIVPWIKSLAVVGLLILVGINAGYLFAGFPLPKPFIDGLMFRIKYGQEGEFPSFLLGEWAQTGWRSYYLIAMFYKLPIPFLLLLLIGLIGLLRGLMPWKRAAWIGIPPVLLIYIMSVHYHINYGVRWLLPALPFLLLIAGFGVQRLLQGNRLTKGLLGALLTWQLAACCLSAPHHLAYFNELAGGPARARHILLDSNLDWGQDLGRLKDYMDQRAIGEIRLGYFGHVDPHLYGIHYSLPPAQPEPGVYAISANYLGGYPYAVTYAGSQIVPVPAGAWSWLNAYEPAHLVGRSIYVFEISQIKPAQNAPLN